MNITDQILNQVQAFMSSRAILTAAELDIFTQLHKKPALAQELAQNLSLDIRALTRLLDTLVTRDLLHKQDEVYQLTEQGALLSADHEQSILPMVLHMNDLWDSWSQLTATVQKGINPDLKPVTAQDQETCQAFIGAMHVVGREMATEIAAQLDLSPYKTLLDIGGASGTYTIAFLHQAPWLSAVLLDLPRVIPLAEDRLRKAGLLDRVQLAAGDFYQEPLPEGCDLALLSAIIHQNSPEENLELYKKTFQALEPGGALLIRDHIMSEDRLQPPEGTIFALNMLVNTRGGDTYTYSEVQDTLQQAGFEEVQLLRQGSDMDCLLLAHKPS